MLYKHIVVHHNDLISINSRFVHLAIDTFLWFNGSIKESNFHLCECSVCVNELMVLLHTLEHVFFCCYWGSAARATERLHADYAAALIQFSCLKIDFKDKWLFKETSSISLCALMLLLLVCYFSIFRTSPWDNAFSNNF